MPFSWASRVDAVHATTANGTSSPTRRHQVVLKNVLVKAPRSPERNRERTRTGRRPGRQLKTNREYPAVAPGPVAEKNSDRQTVFRRTRGESPPCLPVSLLR